MQNQQKHLIIASAISFTAGIALTLTVFALACCPEKPKADFAPRPELSRRSTDPQIAHPRRFIEYKDKSGIWHNRPTPGFRPKEPTPEAKERFAKKLGLSEDQKRQIEENRQKDIKELDAIHEQMEALRQSAAKIRNNGRKNFEALLTPKQKEILKTMHPRLRRPQNSRRS